MTSLLLCLLPVVLLSLIKSATPIQETSEISGPAPSSHRYTPLGLLLRKRSLAAALRGPPLSSLLADSLVEKRSAKRDDGYWIWMPAHGYMPVPRDEAEQIGGQSSTGNLFRYGRG